MSYQLRPSARALSDVAAQVADGGRLARGRLYFRQGAVSITAIESHEVSGTVTGSRTSQYRVRMRSSPLGEAQIESARKVADELRVRGELLEDPDQVHRLVDALAQRPTTGLFDSSTLRFSCDCPDIGDPCKHGVALVMAFADAVHDDARTLLEFRGLDPMDLDTTPDGDEAEQSENQDQDQDRAEEQGTEDEEAGIEDDDGTAEISAGLIEFFSGAMPDGELALGDLAPLNPVFRTVPVVIDGVDAGPVFADAMEWIAEGLSDL